MFVVSLTAFSSKEGAYVYGLYLDGAGWDKNKTSLIQSSPKVLFTPLPLIHIFAINSFAPVALKHYVCPIYEKQDEQTWITSQQWCCLP